eukprot:scaffold69086_cov46-Phaeocystis_antarctica.AAC.1
MIPVAPLGRRRARRVASRRWRAPRPEQWQHPPLRCCMGHPPRRTGPPPPRPPAARHVPSHRPRRSGCEGPRGGRRRRCQPHPRPHPVGSETAAAPPGQMRRSVAAPPGPSQATSRRSRGHSSR